MLKPTGLNSSSMLEILQVDEQPTTLAPSGNTFPQAMGLSINAE